MSSILSNAHYCYNFKNSENSAINVRRLFRINVLQIRKLEIHYLFISKDDWH